MSGTRDRKGYLISVEGIDGAGKSTQIRMLADWLQKQDIKAIILKEPTNGPYGSEIARRATAHKPTTPDEEMMLFMMDRREDVKNNILPALQEGKVVVMDRYYQSNMAYQGARGLDPRKIEEDNRQFSPEPDLVIVLDIDPAASLARIVNQRKSKLDAFEKEEYLHKVRDIFLGIGRRPNGVIIDANGATESVHEAITTAIRLRLPDIF